MIDVFKTIGDRPVTQAIADAMIITAAKIRNYKAPLLSISGGSDSDIMLDMCWRLDPDKKVTYKFVNTGIEYEATKRHIKFLEQKYQIEIEEMRATVPVPLGCKKYGEPFLTKHVSEMISRLQRHNFQWEDEPFEVLYERYPKCKSALRWWCNQHTNPGGKASSMNISKHLLLKEFMIEHPPDFHISPMCCEGAKKRPFRAIEQEQGYDLVCVGIRKFENGIRSQQYKNCFTPGDSHDNYRPIFWFTESDKQIYEKCFNVIHSDCYHVWGMTRTGCAGCPFGSGFEDELELIINNEPKLYKAVAKIFHNSYEYTRRYREYKNSHKTSRNTAKPMTGQISIFDFQEVKN